MVVYSFRVFRLTNLNVWVYFEKNILHRQLSDPDHPSCSCRKDLPHAPKAVSYAPWCGPGESDNARTAQRMSWSGFARPALDHTLQCNDFL